MGVKEMIQKMGQKRKDKKEILKRMLQQDELENIVIERKKSANERELNRYVNEDREAQIKEQLDFMRKKRERDINFNHNPLDVKNITSGTEWEVLKEKNQFTKRGNMFANNENIHKSNKNLLKSGNTLNNQGNIMSNNNSMFGKGGGLI